MSAINLRSYINTQIRDTNSSFKEHKDISTENTKSGIIDKVYHMRLNEISNIETDGDFVYDNFNGTVTFFLNGYRYTQENFDSNLDLVHSVAKRAVNVDRYENGLKKFTVISITPVPTDTNDNLMRFEMNFEAQYMNSAV